MWVWSGYQCIQINIYIHVNICIFIQSTSIRSSARSQLHSLRMTGLLFLNTCVCVQGWARSREYAKEGGMDGRRERGRARGIGWGSVRARANE